MNEINGLSALEFQKIVLSKINKLSAELEHNVKQPENLWLNCD